MPPFVDQGNRSWLREHGRVDAGQTSDRRLDAAVTASLAWYEDVFSIHGIPSRRESGLWRALADPPRWHSVAKTLHPHVPTVQVLRAVDRFQDCSVADSYSTLDLADDGFRELFRATWLYRPASIGFSRSLPDGWSVVADAAELAAWNTAQDTSGVLIPALLQHPRFTFLVRRSCEELVAGAVLHHVHDVVELSNTWARGDEADEIPSMLLCAETLYPQLAVVGYSRNDMVRAFTDAGFDAIAPHVVWVREQ